MDRDMPSDQRCMVSCVVGCVSGGHSSTKIQDQHSAQGTLPNAVPAIGMQIIFDESLRECRGYSAVVVRAVLLPRANLDKIRGPASKPRLTASATYNSFTDDLWLGLL
jgi:hypothetical protein